MAIIELSECIGHVAIDYSQNNNGSFANEDSFKNIDWNHKTGLLRSVFPVNKGEVYIRVRGIQKDNDNKNASAHNNTSSFFKILVSFAKSEEEVVKNLAFQTIPTFKVSPTDSQQIVDVQWNSAMQYFDSTQSIPDSWDTKIYYRVARSNDEDNSKSLALCGVYEELHDYNDSNLQANNVNSFDTYTAKERSDVTAWSESITLKRNSNQINISVIGVILGWKRGNHQGIFVQKVLYEQGEVDLTLLKASYSKKEIAFYVVLIFCLIFCIVITLKLLHKRRLRTSEVEEDRKLEIPELTELSVESIAI